MKKIKDIAVTVGSVIIFCVAIVFCNISSDAVGRAVAQDTPRSSNPFRNPRYIDELTDKLVDLKLGMTGEDVRGLLGDPMIPHSAKYNQFNVISGVATGGTSVTWEYPIVDPYATGTGRAVDIRPFLLQFVSKDGSTLKLVGWEVGVQRFVR